MDRESLYGSRVRYEERLCLAPRKPYTPQASLNHQRYRNWWCTRWLSRVKKLIIHRTAPRGALISLPVQESAYRTWLCLRTRGERL